MYTATLEGNVHRVRELIDIGSVNISCVSRFAFNEVIFTDVTALHVAIFHNTPDILACLLQAKDIDDVMEIKCREGKGKMNDYSALQLAIKVAKDTGDKKARMVSTIFIF